MRYKYHILVSHQGFIHERSLSNKVSTNNLRPYFTYQTKIKGIREKLGCAGFPTKGDF